MFPCIIDWRWGLLTFAMIYVLARKTALQTFSAQKFVKSAKGKNPQISDPQNGGVGALNPVGIQTSVQTPFFWIYMRFLIVLHGIPLELRKWSEGCRCHDFLREGVLKDGEDIAEAPMDKLLATEHVVFAESLPKDMQLCDGPRFVCPVRSRPAVELSLGKLTEVLHQLCETCGIKILAGCQECSREDVACLMKDFSSAKGYLDAALNSSLGYWQHLPWSLCRLADFDEKRAQSNARQLVREFDASEQWEELHDKVTWQALSAGARLRSEIEQFMAGTPRERLPELAKFAAEFAFMPVAERLTEAEHYRVNRYYKMWKSHRSP